MPVKWSALRVSEAMDMAEEFVGQAVEPPAARGEAAIARQRLAPASIGLEQPAEATPRGILEFLGGFGLCLRIAEDVAPRRGPGGRQIRRERVGHARTLAQPRR